MKPTIEPISDEQYIEIELMDLEQSQSQSQSQSQNIQNIEEFITSRSLPVWHRHLSGKTLNQNKFLYEVHNKFFPIVNPNEYDLRDVKRNHLVIDNIEITGTTSDEAIFEQFNTLTKDSGVLNFLKNHVNQNDFLFAGHNGIRFTHLPRAEMFQKTRPVLTLTQAEKDDGVSFRVIAFGYDVLLNSDPLSPVVATDNETPSVIFDTLYHAIPAEENGVKGARLVVKEHTESNYHQDIDTYLRSFKPSLWEKARNFIKNNPLQFASSIVISNGLTFSTLLAIRLTFPESFLGTIATALTDVSSIPNFLAPLATFTVNSFLGGTLGTGIGNIIAERATRKSVEYYHHFIGSSRDYKPNEHVKPEISDSFDLSHSENTDVILELPEDTAVTKKLVTTPLYKELPYILNNNGPVIELLDYDEVYVETPDNDNNAFTSVFSKLARDMNKQVDEKLLEETNNQPLSNVLTVAPSIS